MKKSIFILILTSLVSLAFGQMTIKDIKNGNYGTPEQRAQQANDMMQKGLQLTPNQMPSIKEINLRYSYRIENEVVKMPMSDWSRYRKISAIQSDKDKELTSVLTPDQLKRYKKKRDELFWEGVKAYFF